MNPFFAAATDPVPVIDEMKNSVMGRLYSHFSGHESNAFERILLIAGLAAIAHATVKLIRFVSEWLIIRSHTKENPFGFVTEKPKFITVTRLIGRVLMIQLLIMPAKARAPSLSDLSPTGEMLIAGRF